MTDYVGIYAYNYNIITYNLIIYYYIYTIYNNMSQSDYIKYKKISRELKNLNDYPSVLATGDYTRFLEYSSHNLYSNPKPSYNMLTQNTNKIIFGMEKNTTNCPSTFTICGNTNSRENRILSKRSFLTKLPLRPLTSKQINSQVNYSTSRNNLCNCNEK
jgi:hypothetical protein